ncbi:MAG: DUF2807 domain-containing protein [Flavobacteriaceae bacterium]|nr:DUF2807 domain-containing protein [Flavobacteriaceae bacterium]
MKRIVIFLFIASTASLLEAQQKAEKTIMTGGFDTINVYAGIQVNVIKGDENKIILSDNNEDKSVFIYKIKNNILKLKVGIDKRLSLGNVFVDVYYTNEIDAINLYQGSKLFLKTPITQTNFNIKAQEGSSFEGKVVTEKTNIHVASGGAITVLGKTSVLDIIATTGGLCLAEELSSNQTKIQANIGAVVYAKASVLMDAKASLGAIIRAHGESKKSVYKSFLGGSIKQMK